ncbi:class IIb bacteriocin, lactobin A/cerein 7B family [Tenacibaculum maritimum]
MKNLKNYSCVELNQEELKTITGGFGAFIVAGLAATYYLGYAIGYYQNH